MVGSMESHDIVNLGAIGRYYSCRNVLGFYRCVSALAVCNYSTNKLADPDSWAMGRFANALHQTVQYHPSLCYGIVDQTPVKEAHFLRLRNIFKEDVLEFCGQSPEEAQHGDDATVAKLLQRSNTEILLDGNRKPPWRLVILKHGGQWGSESQQMRNQVQRLSIVFFANHATADGLSHMNFLRTLFHFFNNPQAEDLPWPYQVPRDLRCPILLEDAVDLQSKDENDSSQPDYSAPNVWTGPNIFLPSAEEYESCVAPDHSNWAVTWPCGHLSLTRNSFGQLDMVLQFCRSRQITLTGLLHGLVVTFLSREIPSGHMFRADTPYSMRYLTKVADDEICNHASALISDFPESLVNEIRNIAPSSSQELEVVIGIAKDYRRDMAAELKISPKNNMWAAMFGIDDWYGSSLGQIGKKRGLTYELSNFGNVKVVDNVETDSSSLRLEKVFVSQCGSVTGPLFGCTSVSIPGGPLTMTLVWQKGGMEEQMVSGMAKYLTERLLAGFDSVRE
ncbi:hypothetical protein V498_06968 [Pseudogymnoascus sp. VKM F-4517 (FW-2822)]|nr:hypothetical protein V498_06968 [Pseudogymnoascus sp. VKM F-4517 (FW-2822)]